MSTDLKKYMVSFRLSEEEYHRLREICFSHGLGTISQMARTALNGLCENPSGASSQSLEIRMNELEGRLKVLASDLRKLQNRGPASS